MSNENQINNDLPRNGGGSVLPNNKNVSDLQPPTYERMNTPQPNSDEYVSIPKGSVPQPQPRTAPQPHGDMSFDFSQSNNSNQNDDFDLNSFGGNQDFNDTETPQMPTADEEETANTDAVVHEMNENDYYAERKRKRKRVTKLSLSLITVLMLGYLGYVGFMGGGNESEQQANEPSAYNQAQSANSSLNGETAESQQVQNQNAELQAALGNGGGGGGNSSDDIVGVGGGVPKEAQNPVTEQANPTETATAPMASAPVMAAAPTETEQANPVNPTPLVAAPSAPNQAAKETEQPNAAAANTQAAAVSLKDDKGQPKWDYFFAETGLSDKEKQAAALKARLEAITGKKFALFPNDEQVAASETAKTQAATENPSVTGIGEVDTTGITAAAAAANAQQHAEADKYVKQIEKQKIKYDVGQGQKTVKRKSQTPKKAVIAKKPQTEPKINKVNKPIAHKNLPYQAQAIVFGQVWLNLPKGTRSYVNGDTLPNGARILEINPNSRTIKTNLGTFKVD